ncbi:MAG: pyridine nucleotide-disulfide oxidoreductase [Acidobacteria bacterium]|nr:MAG: pyridine nucleotide-disulfide oxidoreductase [Acidobacteriota bacterium]
MDKHYDVIIFGAGPAGLTAGIYLGRARAKTLILDTATVGGQTVLSYSVANYPGVEETSGREISQTMLRQAKSFGCEVRPYARIAEVELAGPEKAVTLENGSRFTFQVAVVATGGVPRKLGLESEEAFVSKGISFCATCDGDFFSDRPIAIIGGGNSALEEAIALSAFASHITIIHEFDHFQAEPWIVEEVRANPKMEFLMEQDIREFEGGGSLERVITKHKRTGEITVTPVDGCFIFIGYVANSSLVEGSVTLNDRGEIVTDEELRTNLPGVFAAGDVRAKRYRQITTAVADGTVAAMAALETLRGLER